MTRNEQGVPIWCLTFKSAIADDDGNSPFFHREIVADTQALADVIGLGMARDEGDFEFVESEETYYVDDACPLVSLTVVLQIRAKIHALVEKRNALAKVAPTPLVFHRSSDAGRTREGAKLDGGIAALNDVLTSFGLAPSPTAA